MILVLRHRDAAKPRGGFIRSDGVNVAAELGVSEQARGENGGDQRRPYPNRHELPIEWSFPAPGTSDVPTSQFLGGRDFLVVGDALGQPANGLHAPERDDEGDKISVR